MVETFKWRTERGTSATIGYRVIETQFGDGYMQTTADGINTKTEEYGIKIHAKEAIAQEIMDFFDRHAGFKTFLWKPSLGKLGLYACKDPTPHEEGGGLYSITGTFVKRYASMS